MNLSRPAMRAFAADMLDAVAHFATLPRRYNQLLAAHRALVWEVKRLSDANLAGIEPPTFSRPISEAEISEGLAVLDSDDCGPSDLLWLWGEVR